KKDKKKSKYKPPSPPTAPLKPSPNDTHAISDPTPLFPLDQHPNSASAGSSNDQQQQQHPGDQQHPGEREQQRERQKQLALRGEYAKLAECNDHEVATTIRLGLGLLFSE
ncbi:unnamed protein product, partial [Symbiodinium microadriaticum]